MRNKDLSEIRPARTGVKLKNRNPRPRPKPERAKVVRGADPSAQKGNLQPPTEEAAHAVADAQKARAELMDAVRHINRKIMSSKVLPENRSASQTALEKEAIHRLWNAAVALDRVSPGEGLLGVSILAVRQGLLLRDAGNRQAYEMTLLKKEMDTLRSADEEAKREMEDLRAQVESLGQCFVGLYDDGYGDEG